MNETGRGEETRPRKRNPTPERRLAKRRSRTPSPPRPTVTKTDSGAKKDSESKPLPPPPIKTAEQRLRDQIREEIAQEKLQEQFEQDPDLLAEISRQEWIHYDAAKDKAAPKTDSPDFAALAREYNMTAGRTGLVSQIELMELDVGKSVNVQQRMPVVQLVFGATTLYKPDVSDYLQGFPSRQENLLRVLEDRRPARSRSEVGRGGHPGRGPAGLEARQGP